ncbi:hypothetical protein IC762_34025 [Bradyrhizobium genosp. L]|uniref:hypothetical protein n=1 Tax=Bradyrhizobium genosp. L TaxID=83637 RepID=UPI0018A29145|nr:hypothetical protein [Bradyrhizobium genosp. L]QPF84565.1 hypothetical protein IC762_34025 [Bradyrhizobium genosp. L]
MTRLSISGTHAPAGAHQSSEEDRATYRRWARRAWLAYFIVIALMIVTVSLRDRPDSQLASRDQSALAGTATMPAPQPAGAVARSD